MATVDNYGPKKGKKGLPVNLIGRGFSALHNVRVRFGATEIGAPMTQVKNDQHVKTEVPDLADGPVALVLVADEISGGILAGGFTVGIPPEGPAITDVYPDVLRANDTVFIFGYGFTTGRSATQVLFNATVVPIVSAEDTVITVKAPMFRPGTATNISLAFSDGKQVVATEVPVYQ